MPGTLALPRARLIFQTVSKSEIITWLDTWNDTDISISDFDISRGESSKFHVLRAMRDISFIPESLLGTAL